MSTDPRANNVLVEALATSLQHGGSALGDIPELLKRVILEGSWQEFVTRRGEHVEHRRFADFVERAPLGGLGATADLLYDICREQETVDLLDKAFGRKRRSDRVKVTGNVDNVHDNGDQARPTGNSARYALRKLRKDAPELHADVLAGRLSAHAAMVKAGFRPRTVSVPFAHPDAVAAVLRKHMTAEGLAELIRLLAGEA
jgi:hypothetical protein